MSDQLIYTGKAKDIYSTEDEHVIKSVYKDQATMLNGARKETIEGKGVLKVDGEVGNKKTYDPRVWGAAAEAGMAARVVEACQQLGSVGTSIK